MSDTRSIETDLIHAGVERPLAGGAVTPPVFQSSTFECAGLETYHDLKYIRLNNTPNHEVLGRRLATLERGEAGLVTGSGMAAITTTLLTLLGSGDHLLAQRGLYGGSSDFCANELPRLGIAVDLFDGDRPESWRELVRDETRAVYCESITNPRMRVADLPAIVRLARDRGIVSVIDNTFATPVHFRPIELGFDVVLHSATKYLNGHNDIVAGAVVGDGAFIERVTHRLNHLGGSLDPHACFLLERGLKTLALRVRQQSHTALELARALEANDGVDRVHYAGLESHPDHARARELFAGFGGMLAFEVAGGAERADRVLAALEIPIVAPSLGGLETLIVRPAVTTNFTMTPEERADAGIRDELLRVSVGAESTADLVADFERALASA